MSSILSPLAYLARQNAQNALVKIHDRVVAAFVLVDDRIRVKSDDEEVAEAFGLLQEVEMADVEQVEGAGDVNNLIARRGTFPIAELNDPLGRRQELTGAGPR